MHLEQLWAVALRDRPEITLFELFVLTMAWVRIYLDGEDWDTTVRWAKKQLVEPDRAADTVRALREDGLSIRQIADRTGVPKSTVARLLSHAA